MIKQKIIFFLCTFLYFALQANFTPPAGVVERELEEQYEDPSIDLKENPLPLLQWDKPQKTVISGDETVTLHQIEVTGNHVFSSEELEAAVRSYLQRPLSLNDLEEICSVIQNIYEKKGYFLVVAYLPFQELTEGILTIQVIEGKVGAITVEGNTVYATSFIEAPFLSYQQQPLHYKTFLKRLLLLNEIMDLKVEASLKQGKERGTVDLTLHVQDQTPFHGAIDLNNEGCGETTTWRSGMRLDNGNWFVQGDKITVIQVAGAPPSHLYFFDLIYTLPLNFTGLSLETSYLGAFFKTSPLQMTKYKGKSQVEEMKLIYAYQRTPLVSINTFGQLQRKKIQNFGNDSMLSDDKLTVLGLGISFEGLDVFKGRSLIEGKISGGIPRFLGSMKAISPDSSRVGAGGSFLKVNADFKRLHPLQNKMIWKLKGSLQLSLNRLPLAEQFYLGGADTVRGYPLADEMGDHGYFLSSELQMPFSLFKKNQHISSEERGVLVGFIDVGQTFSIGNKDLIRGYLPLQTNAFLCSVGTGIRLKLPYQMKCSLDLGFAQTQEQRGKLPLAYFKLGRNF
ncbi:MAG: ShlB/FhaC/HecB family hemolysin secretion/activation protein [Candidatus Rhabdochlamydia sp.]